MSRRLCRGCDLRGRLPALIGLVALAMLAPGIALAAQLSVTSARLGTATAVPPPFHLTMLTVTRAGKQSGAPSKGDVLLVRLSQRLRAASVCPGFAETFPQTLTGVTVELVDGGVEPDLLRIGAGPAQCPTPQAASFTLGSTAYNTGAVISFTASSITLRNDTATTSTLTVTLGTPTRPPAGVNASSVVTATPALALRDTSGRAISPGATDTVLQTQF